MRSVVELEERIAQLEERLAQLEGRPGVGPILVWKPATPEGWKVMRDIADHYTGIGTTMRKFLQLERPADAAKRQAG